MNKKDKVQLLLNKYQAGTCTQTELQQLLKYMKEDESLYEQLAETVNHDWWELALLADPHLSIPESKQGNNRLQHRAFWSVAASVLVLIAAGVTLWFKVNTGTIAYYTDYGERQQIELPDGSQVELNANSYLTWNKNWKRSGIRTVELGGEAYFDVVKSEAKRFQVKTNEVVVQVLGTSFNISNRRGETKVFLEEGKVELNIENEEELTMIPGEKVEYSSKVKKITRSKHETMHSAAAWKTGVISFQKMPLSEIISELGDIYGIDLICPDDALNQKIMDVGVPYLDWEATKNSLELAMKVVIIETAETFIITSKN